MRNTINNVIFQILQDMFGNAVVFTKILIVFMLKSNNSRINTNLLNCNKINNNFNVFH